MCAAHIAPQAYRAEDISHLRSKYLVRLSVSDIAAFVVCDITDCVGCDIVTLR